MVEPIFRLTKLGRQQQHADKIINEYANKVILLKKEEIRRRREEAGAGGTADTAEEPTADADVGVRKKYTFLDLVLEQDSELMSDEEILNEVRTLIAVQQTSASTLSFVAVCLALHPDVQRLAREEVLRVDAAEGLSPIERLNRLKYVERVVKETLRLYPITSIFSRTISEDTVLTRVPTKTG
jgi:cytochrome P450